MDERVTTCGRVFGQAQRGFSVGFLLLQYSVVILLSPYYTFVLSPFYILGDHGDGASKS